MLDNLSTKSFASENKISVIIPAFNSEKTIMLCIDSVLSQTYDNFEIIIVNDGSTDKSLEIINSYLENEPRIRVINQDNRGVSASRNAGIKVSTGEFLVFIDSDDYVKPDYLDSLINHKYKVDLLISGYEKEFNINKRYTQIIIQDEFYGEVLDFIKIIMKYFKTPILQGPCWKLFKRNLILNNSIFFPENMNYGEDTYFILEYLKVCKKVAVIKEHSYIYTVANINSLSNVLRADKFEIELLLIDKLEKLCLLNLASNKDEIDSLICEVFYNYCNNLVLNLSLSKKKKLNILSLNIAMINKRKSLKMSRCNYRVKFACLLAKKNYKTLLYLYINIIRIIKKYIQNGVLNYVYAIF